MLFVVEGSFFNVVSNRDKAKKSRDCVLEGYPSLAAEFFDLTSISAWVEGKTSFQSETSDTQWKSNSRNLV